MRLDRSRGWRICVSLDSSLDFSLCLQRVCVLQCFSVGSWCGSTATLQNGWFYTFPACVCVCLCALSALFMLWPRKSLSSGHFKSGEERREEKEGHEEEARRGGVKDGAEDTIPGTSPHLLCYWAEYTLTACILKTFQMWGVEGSEVYCHIFFCYKFTWLFRDKSKLSPICPKSSGIRSAKAFSLHEVQICMFSINNTLLA